MVKLCLLSCLIVFSCCSRRAAITKLPHKLNAEMLQADVLGKTVCTIQKEDLLALKTPYRRTNSALKSKVIDGNKTLLNHNYRAKLQSELNPSSKLPISRVHADPETLKKRFLKCNVGWVSSLILALSSSLLWSIVADLRPGPADWVFTALGIGWVSFFVLTLVFLILEFIYFVRWKVKEKTMEKLKSEPELQRDAKFKGNLSRSAVACLLSLVLLFFDFIFIYISAGMDVFGLAFFVCLVLFWVLLALAGLFLLLECIYLFRWLHAKT